MVYDKDCQHASYVYNKIETSAGTTIRSKIPPNRAKQGISPIEIPG